MSTPNLPSPPPDEADAPRVAIPFVYDPPTYSYVARCPGCGTLVGQITAEAVDARAARLRARGVAAEAAAIAARPGFARGRHVCPKARP